MNDKYDVKRRVHTLEQRKVWNIGLEPASGTKVYEYEADESGNWITRREFYQSRGDSTWSMKTITRTFTYYPLD